MFYKPQYKGQHNKFKVGSSNSFLRHEEDVDFLPNNSKNPGTKMQN